MRNMRSIKTGHLWAFRRGQVELGYKMTKIHEIWHFDKLEKYDKATKTGGIFTDYINAFLKMKQYADGFPSLFKTEQQKKDYVHQYQQVEGILLDIGKIAKNPGMRALEKLMLNSFWGKFGQRNNQTKMEYFTEPEKFIKLMFNDKWVKSLQYFGEQMVAAQYIVEDEFLESLKHTNPIIASYVMWRWFFY